MATSAALASTARQAEAALTEKVLFASNRTTGTGVNNTTGDFEIFKMNPDGTGVRQLTLRRTTLGPHSPDGKKIAYTSLGVQASNPEDDQEAYVMNASDGAARKNLTNNGQGTHDNSIDWGVQAV